MVLKKSVEDRVLNLGNTNTGQSMSIPHFYFIFSERMKLNSRLIGYKEAFIRNIL